MMIYSHPEMPTQEVLIKAYSELPKDKLIETLIRDSAEMVRDWQSGNTDSIHKQQVKHWAIIESIQSGAIVLDGL